MSEPNLYKAVHIVKLLNNTAASSLPILHMTDATLGKVCEPSGPQ